MEFVYLKLYPDRLTKIYGIYLLEFIIKLYFFYRLQPATSVADLPPLPDMSADIEDANFLAWLQENSRLTLDERTAASLNPEVRTRYQRYLQALERSQTAARTRRHSLVPDITKYRSHNDITMSTSTNSRSGSSSSGKKQHGGGIRNPIKSLAHMLHLDWAQRKRERELRRAEEARLREEMDMERWTERLKRHHQRKLERTYITFTIPI